MIPHSRPSLGEEEVAAVMRVVQSGMIAEGPEVAALEQELAAREEVPRAAAVAHGTGAIHLSLLALGIGAGDRVLIPSYACISLLNPVAYVGAEAVLVDCLPDRPDMDLQQACRRADADPRIRAAIVPHMFGRHAPVAELANRVAVIEDSTHSLGHPAPLLGETRVASFFATKLMAGGEGGIVLCRRSELHQTICDLRSYDERPDWIPRFNYKMTDMSAALVRVQLSRLDAFLERRAALAQYYAEQLKSRVELQPGQVHYRFLILCNESERIMGELQALGIGVRRPVFRPIHRYLNQPDGEFPQSTSFWNRCLSLPLYPTMSEDQAAQVVAALRQCGLT